MALRARTIGYLVPDPFAGVVHGVHARACNVAADGSLLTLVAPGIADGPTIVVLDGEPSVDLRTCFRIGARIARAGAQLTSPDVVVDLAPAQTWRPDPTPRVGDAARSEINMRVAASRLAMRIGRDTSIVHRAEGRAVCARVEQACRDGDVDAAISDAIRLIGWGEGLTPAGDDFLVGLLAGLDALATDSPQRGAFLERFGAALAAQTQRTTEIAAHYLRLAAGGHFGADAHRLRSALLSSRDVARVGQLVDDALAVGATSGADHVTGVLAGLSAWLPSATHERLA